LDEEILGKFKIEKRFDKGTFIAPKLYMLEGKEIYIKSKGVKKMTREDFLKL
jgi:hypothetical protein